MAIFDFIKDLAEGGITENLTGGIDEALGNITENEAIQNLEDKISEFTGGGEGR